MCYCESRIVVFLRLFLIIMIFRFRGSLTNQLERMMSRAVFDNLIGACFVMCGGIAGARVIRYVAASGVVMADRTFDDNRCDNVAEVSYGDVQRITRVPFFSRFGYGMRPSPRLCFRLV